jgi:hypothetical protein
VQWKQAMENYHEAWAFMLFSFYNPFVPIGDIEWGCPAKPAGIKDMPAVEADLKDIEAAIVPEQEGVLLWMLQKGPLPGAAAVLNARTEKPWQKLAMLDKCFEQAHAARKNRAKRLAASKEKLRQAAEQSRQAKNLQKDALKPTRVGRSSGTGSSTEDESSGLVSVSYRWFRFSVSSFGFISLVSVSTFVFGFVFLVSGTDNERDGTVASKAQAARKGGRPNC